MKRNIFVLLLFSLHCIVPAQSITSKPLDSLAQKSYQELKDIFYKYQGDDNVLAEKIARYTLKRARKEKVYEAVANSYIRLHYVYEDDRIIAEQYIDTSIIVCNTHNLKGLLAENYSHKGDLHYRSKEYNSALKYYLQSRDYYNKLEDRESYYILQYSIGLIKLRMLENEEALNIFKDCFAYQEEIKKEEDTIVSYNYLSVMRSLVIAYAANGKIDSTTLYNKKGYHLAKLHPEYNELKFTHLEGGNQFLKGNYKAAEDSLLKALPLLKRFKSKENLAIAYSHLGRIYKQYNELDKTVFYFKKIDSIYNVDKYIIPKPREIYEGLINYYKEKEDIKQQLYFTEQLLTIDSVLTKDFIALNKTFKEYDISNLTKEKERLVSLLNKEQSVFKRNTVLFFIITLLLVLLFTYLYCKKINNEKRFNQIINELQSKSNQSRPILLKKPVKATLDIDQKLIDAILKDLKLFEANKDYLTPKITLYKLAKNLNTNSKYLSKVINKFKFKTFNNYINDLRIDYVMQQLQNNSTLKKYTIKAMAEEVGFASKDTFTKAFFKKNGITVSYFIKKLE